MSPAQLREKALGCTVISLVPHDLYEEKPGLIPGRFYIPASDCKIPSLLHVKNSIHYVYLDDTRGSLQARDPSEEVARSIVNDYINSQLALKEDARPGIMWTPGIMNLEEVKSGLAIELTRLKICQNNWFTELVRMADDDWSRYRKHTVISDFQRKIADIMQLRPEQHEWMSITTATSTMSALCPSCFTPVDPRATRCPHCQSDIKKPSEVQIKGS